MRKVVIISQIVVFSICLMIFGAANCPDGTPQVSYSNENKSGTGNQDGGDYHYQITITVDVTLNCDVDPCLEDFEFDVDIEFLDGNVQTHTGTAHPAGDLCNDGDSATLTLYFSATYNCRPVDATISGFDYE